MTPTRKALYATVILLGVGTALWLLHRKDVKTDSAIASPTLKPQDEAKIIIDPVHHSIEVIQRTGADRQTSTRHYLPDRKSAVILGKDGSINVETRTYGTEVAPFIGVVTGLRFSGAVGLNVFYIHRFELGVGVSSDLRDIKNTRMFVGVQFNAYDNISLGIAVDHTGKPLGLLSVKF